MKMSVKEMTTLAIMSAMALILSMFAVFPLVPLVSWLTYDPKDVVIVIGGFIYGPFSVFIMSGITSILEIAIKGGTYVDVLMNMISTCSFACVAAYIYKRQHTKKGAVIGLVLGIIAMTLSMAIWNYVMTPIYYHMPRKAVVSLLLPGIIPFNLLKSSLNACMTLLLYRTVICTLKKANMINKSSESMKGSKHLIIIGTFIIVTVVLVFFAMKGII